MAANVKLILTAKSMIGSALKKAGARVKAFAMKSRRYVLGLGAAFAAALREAHVFSKGMAEVSVMLGENQHLLAGMTRGILSMSMEFGQSKEVLTKGMYDILSAGIDASEAMGVLEVATKAAVGGATDTATAVDGITTVLNAFSMEASEAAHVSDQLFQIVKDGKITYTELSENIGKIAPTARAAGLTLEQMSAAVATLVKVEKPERAMSGLSSALSQAAKQGKNLMEEVHKLKGASLETIMDAGWNKRAATSIALLSSQVDVLDSELETFKNTSGAADEAFDRMSDAQTWAKAWQTFRAAMTLVGMELQKVVMPSVKKATKAFGEFLNKMQSGGIQRVTARMKTFGAEAVFQFTRIKKISGAAFKSVWIMGKVAFQNVGTAAFNAATVTTNAWKGATDNIGHWLAEMWSKVRGEEFNITPPKPPFEDILKGTVALTDASIEIEAVWVKAFDTVRKAGEKAAEKTADAWETADKETQKILKDDAKKTAKVVEKVRVDAVNRVNKAQKAANKERLRQLAAELAAAKQIANAGIQGFMDAKQAAKAAAKQDAKDLKRAERIRVKIRENRGGLGGKLAKKDREFMEAFLAVRAAKQKIANAEAAKKAAQMAGNVPAAGPVVPGQPKIPQAQKKVPNDMLDELIKIRKNTNALPENLQLA